MLLLFTLCVGLSSLKFVRCQETETIERDTHTITQSTYKTKGETASNIWVDITKTSSWAELTFTNGTWGRVGLSEGTIFVVVFVQFTDVWSAIVLDKDHFNWELQQNIYDRQFVDIARLDEANNTYVAVKTDGCVVASSLNNPTVVSNLVNCQNTVTFPECAGTGIWKYSITSAFSNLIYLSCTNVVIQVTIEIRSDGYRANNRTVKKSTPETRVFGNAVHIQDMVFLYPNRLCSYLFGRSSAYFPILMTNNLIVKTIDSRGYDSLTYVDSPYSLNFAEFSHARLDIEGYSELMFGVMSSIKERESGKSDEDILETRLRESKALESGQDFLKQWRIREFFIFYLRRSFYGRIELDESPYSDAAVSSSGNQGIIVKQNQDFAFITVQWKPLAVTIRTFDNASVLIDMPGDKYHLDQILLRCEGCPPEMYLALKEDRVRAGEPSRDQNSCQQRLTDQFQQNLAAFYWPNSYNFSRNAMIQVFGTARRMLFVEQDIVLKGLFKSELVSWPPGEPETTLPPPPPLTTENVDFSTTYILVGVGAALLLLIVILITIRCATGKRKKRRRVGRNEQQAAFDEQVAIMSSMANPMASNQFVNPAQSQMMAMTNPAMSMGRMSMAGMGMGMMPMMDPSGQMFMMDPNAGQMTDPMVHPTGSMMMGPSGQMMMGTNNPAPADMMDGQNTYASMMQQQSPDAPAVYDNLQKSKQIYEEGGYPYAENQDQYTKRDPNAAYERDPNAPYLSGGYYAENQDQYNQRDPNAPYVTGEYADGAYPGTAYQPETVTEKPKPESGSKRKHKQK